MLQIGMSQCVSSKTFKIVINNVVDHSVPELCVNDIDTAENIVFLDARAFEEYEVSHIENAIWVGYDSFSLESIEELEKEKKTVVYCSIGYRSEKITEILLDQGFTDVHNLLGGIFEWKNSGNSVVDETEEDTEDVHAFDKIWGIWLKNGNKVYP